MVTVRLWTPYHCANPSQALQILLLWCLSPRSAPHTTTLWEKENLHMEKSGHGVCVWTYHIHHVMPVIYTPIQEFWTTFNDKVQQFMTNRIPLKWSTTWYDQTRENTAIQWLKKKAFTNFDLVRETKSPDPAWKQMKQDSRVDFNIYTYGCPGSCHWPQPKRILHLRQMIEQNDSRLPMHSMQRMTQTYQIRYHLHMMPCSALASWRLDLFPISIYIYIHKTDKWVLNGVKAHKATGPDEVLARLEWRTANVIPIFKKVNHASSANYKPVSMTSVCSKVMKHNQFPDHETSKYKPLPDVQHGFRKKR